MVWIKEHKLMAFSILVLFLSFSIIGYIFWDMFSNQKPVNNTSEDFHSESVKVDSIAIDYNPFGEQETDLDEEDIQQYIHGMSHQKVKADEKWVHYTMTEERIQFLLEVVQNGDYEHKQLYLDILTRWSKGDFSQADKDHNAVWRLQGGSVGKATGVLTKEEEEAYLEKHQGVMK